MLKEGMKVRTANYEIVEILEIIHRTHSADDILVRTSSGDFLHTEAELELVNDLQMEYESR